MGANKAPQGEIRERWGVKIEMTDKHLSEAEMANLRGQYDELGSAGLEKLQEIFAKQKLEPNSKIAASAKPDLYALLRDHHDEDPKLQEFWTQLQTVPDWVDWAQIERGQECFSRYSLCILASLAFQTPIRENAQSPGVGEVLHRTGGFQHKHMMARAVESAVWLVHCSHSLRNIQPGGDGWISTIRLRLLHASVRQRIFNLVAVRPSYYNIEKHGIPVNDLDSLKAMNFFIYGTVWDTSKWIGIYPTKEEFVDYVAFIRYVSYVLGSRDDYCTSVEQVRGLMETFLLYELAPTKTTQALARNLLNYLVDLYPLNLSEDVVNAAFRVVNGHAVCDALALDKPSWRAYGSFLGLEFCAIALAYTQRAIPAFDRFMIKSYRSYFMKAINYNAHHTGSKMPFEFKYIPQLETKEVDVEDKTEHLKAVYRWPEYLFLLIFFLPFVSAAALMVLSSWYVLRRFGDFFGSIREL